MFGLIKFILSHIYLFTLIASHVVWLGCSRDPSNVKFVNHILKEGFGSHWKAIEEVFPISSIAKAICDRNFPSLIRYLLTLRIVESLAEGGDVVFKLLSVYKPEILHYSFLLIAFSLLIEYYYCYRLLQLFADGKFIKVIFKVLKLLTSTYLVIKTVSFLMRMALGLDMFRYSYRGERRDIPSGASRVESWVSLILFNP